MSKQSIYESFFEIERRYPKIPYSFMKDAVDGKGVPLPLRGKRVKRVKTDYLNSIMR